MSRRTCQRYSTWVPLYAAGTLDPGQAQRLDAHLQHCARCQDDLASQRAVELAMQSQPSIQEPSHLTGQILRRIALYEAARPSARVVASTAPSRTVLAWRYTVVAAVLTVAFALLRPAAWASFMFAVERNLNDVLVLLFSPGPDEISWGVWVLGAGVVGFVMLRFWRADASETWRRELAQRLPQLW